MEINYLKLQEDLENMKVKTITNNKGTAIQFPDGTMICYRNVWTEGWSGGSPDTNYILVELPTSFVDTEYQVVLTNNYNNSIRLIWSVAIQSESTFRAYAVFSSGDTASTPTVFSSANCIAIGRWK